MPTASTTREALKNTAGLTATITQEQAYAFCDVSTSLAREDA
jgi:hypothetical protein